MRGVFWFTFPNYVEDLTGLVASRLYRSQLEATTKMSDLMEVNSFLTFLSLEVKYSKDGWLVITQFKSIIFFSLAMYQ